uniref:Gamma-glutamylcyclotransferase family protein n=1 Tax=Ananas comosus var. bracteatus TaxID=296719 RepID=A0A6V7QXV0_ANACO
MATGKAMMDRTLVFTYGTLKHGFSNHGLLQDLVRSGDAAFVGGAATAGRLPLVCGPYRVPSSSTSRAPATASRGSSTPCRPAPSRASTSSRASPAATTSASRSPSSSPPKGRRRWRWRRRRTTRTGATRGSCGGGAGRRGFGEYSAKETKGYVRRKDRPQDITFLDQIRIFITAAQNL